MAGFTKGAVYSNFKSKDDLFLALLEGRYESGYASLREFLADTETPHVAADFIGRVTDELDDSSGEFWGPLYLEFLVYAMRNPEARERLAELERRDVESVAAIIQAERARHGLGDVHSAEDAARFVIALMRGMFTMRLIEGDAVDDRLVASVLDYLDRALTSG